MKPVNLSNIIQRIKPAGARFKAPTRFADHDNLWSNVMTFRVNLGFNSSVGPVQLYGHFKLGGEAVLV